MTSSDIGVFMRINSLLAAFLALAAPAHGLNLTVMESASIVSCAGSQDCQPCIDEGDAAGEDYALYPITMAAAVNIGYCLPSIYYAYPIDFPFVLNFRAQLFGEKRIQRIGGAGYHVENHQLKLCRSGDYCPFNETVGYYNQKFACSTDGELCWEQSTSPTTCSWWWSCDGDSVQRATGFVVLLVILIVALVGLCGFTSYRQHAMMKASRELAALCKDDDVDAHFGENLIDENLFPPAFLEFENVGLTLNTKGRKAIIQGVTGCVPPKSLVALMGPSGCGKTTFMNCLIDRTPYGTRTGRVAVNGEEGSVLTEKGLFGFVPQDDIVHANMTVFQNLYYHALLRLPPGSGREQAERHVQHCIKLLGLEKVQNSIVGTPENRGISGGQKKRVNIGLELVAMPSFLFMDE